MLAERIRQIVAKQHGVPICGLTTGTDFFQDLDDSLDFAEIVMACEEEFGVSIPTAEAANLRTIGDLTACVRRHAPAEPNVWPPRPSASPRE